MKRTNDREERLLIRYLASAAAPKAQRFGSSVGMAQVEVLGTRERRGKYEYIFSKGRHEVVESAWSAPAV